MKPTSTTWSGFSEAGLVISAITQRDKLTEIVELPRDVHPWFIGVPVPPRIQEHALGRPSAVHRFVKAALDHQARR